MSDISASDAGAAPEGAVSEAPAGDFDLDAAVEEFASNAPDEWKGKASKIQSELKNLRSKYTPYRDTFDGLHEGDRDALLSLASMVKDGNTEGAVEWLNSALTSLTPAEKAEIQADIEEAEAAGEPEISIEERIQKALDERDNAAKEALAAQERQNKINSDFAALGYNVERDKTGRLTDFTTQQVAMLAINDHGGDIAKAHEAYEKWLGDQAKAYLQKHQGDKSLLAEGGTPTTAGEGAENLTPAQRAQARINRLMEGPAA